MRKKDIDVFGEASVAEVLPLHNMVYAVVRCSDNAVLAKAPRFKKYVGDIVRTMYTGNWTGKGDVVLESDRNGVIYTFR